MVDRVRDEPGHGGRHGVGRRVGRERLRRCALVIDDPGGAARPVACVDPVLEEHRRRLTLRVDRRREARAGAAGRGRVPGLRRGRGRRRRRRGRPLERSDVALAACGLRPCHATLVDRQWLAREVGAVSGVDGWTAGRECLRRCRPAVVLHWPQERVPVHQIAGGVEAAAVRALQVEAGGGERARAGAVARRRREVARDDRVLESSLAAVQKRATGRVGVVACDREVADQRVPEAVDGAAAVVGAASRDRH